MTLQRRHRFFEVSACFCAGCCQREEILVLGSKWITYHSRDIQRRFGGVESHLFFVLRDKLIVINSAWSWQRDRKCCHTEMATLSKSVVFKISRYEKIVLYFAQATILQISVAIALTAHIFAINLRTLSSK